MKQSYWFILALIHNLPENRFGIVKKKRRKKDSCVVGAFCFKIGSFSFRTAWKSEIRPVAPRDLHIEQYW